MTGVYRLMVNAKRALRLGSGPGIRYILQIAAQLGRQIGRPKDVLRRIVLRTSCGVQVIIFWRYTSTFNFFGWNIVHTMKMKKVHIVPSASEYSSTFLIGLRVARLDGGMLTMRIVEKGEIQQWVRITPGETVFFRNGNQRTGHHDDRLFRDLLL